MDVATAGSRYSRNLYGNGLNEGNICQVSVEVLGRWHGDTRRHTRDLRHSTRTTMAKPKQTRAVMARCSNHHEEPTRNMFCSRYGRVFELHLYCSRLGESTVPPHTPTVLSSPGTVSIYKWRGYRRASLSG